MFPSETRFLDLLETLRDAAVYYKDTYLLAPRVSALPYRNAASIWIRYPRTPLITINLFVRNEQLFANIASSAEQQEIRKSIKDIIQEILPHVIFIEPDLPFYRRNSDDDLRKAERRWKETGSEEDQKRYEIVARRAGLCPKCQGQTLLEDDCQLCNLPPCENCDSPINCERCGDWVCDDCQRQCTHCEDAYCYECIEKCPYCKKDFCKPGAFSLTEGRFVNAPSCLPPGPDGHGCPDWDDQFED